MKYIGGKWFVKLYKHLENNPHIVVNGFKHAGIFKVLDMFTDVDYS